MKIAGAGVKAARVGAKIAGGGVKIAAAGRFGGAGRLAGCVAFVLVGMLAVASPPAGQYHLLKKAPLGAAAGGGREYFDYLTVDSHARRVYASHGTEVKVADADSGAVVGTISGLKQCHGIVLVEELGKGFISDGGAAKTVIFDMASLKAAGEVKGEEDADSIIYDPASKHVFVFNGDAKSATVIDPANGAVVRSSRSPMARERFTTTLKTRMKWWRSIPARCRSSHGGQWRRRDNRLP